MNKSWIRLLTATMVVLFSITLAADKVDESQYGVYQPGGYLIGFTDPDSRVIFKNKQVTFQPNGLYVIGFSREDEGIQEITFVDRVGATRTQLLDIGTRTYNIQRINGVQSSKVSPPKDVEQRIALEYLKVKEIRKLQSNQTSWQKPFIWPVYGPITGVYGSQRILNGVKKNPHFGVDVARARGTPVFAPNSGRVVLADDLYFSGNTVIIDHGIGVLSTLMHMDDILVSTGDPVRQGAIVGHVGSTGRSTGPHLDWRINLNDIRVDPEFWVPPMASICDILDKDQDFKSKEVVILLHGLDHKGSTMEQLGQKLFEEGYAVCSQHYSSVHHSLEVQSGYLANAIAKTQQSGYSKVHVLTLGVGGLIARYYLQHISLPGEGAVIMLDPPMNGINHADQFGRYRWFKKIKGPAAINLSTNSKILSNQLSPIRSDVGIITTSIKPDPRFSFLFQDRSAKTLSMLSLTPPETQRVNRQKNPTLTLNSQRVFQQIQYFLNHQVFMK